MFQQHVLNLQTTFKIDYKHLQSILIGISCCNTVVQYLYKYKRILMYNCISKILILKLQKNIQKQ